MKESKINATAPWARAESSLDQFYLSRCRVVQRRHSLQLLCHIFGQHQRVCLSLNVVLQLCQTSVSGTDGEWRDTWEEAREREEMFQLGGIHFTWVTLFRSIPRSQVELLFTVNVMVQQVKVLTLCGLCFWHLPGTSLKHIKVYKRWVQIGMEKRKIFTCCWVEDKYKVKNPLCCLVVLLDPFIIISLKGLKVSQNNKHWWFP